MKIIFLALFCASYYAGSVTTTDFVVIANSGLEENGFAVNEILLAPKKISNLSVEGVAYFHAKHNGRRRPDGSYHRTSLNSKPMEEACVHGQRKISRATILAFTGHLMMRHVSHVTPNSPSDLSLFMKMFANLSDAQKRDRLINFLRIKHIYFYVLNSDSYLDKQIRDKHLAFNHETLPEPILTEQEVGHIKNNLIHPNTLGLRVFKIWKELKKKYPHTLPSEYINLPSNPYKGLVFILEPSVRVMPKDGGFAHYALTLLNCIKIDPGAGKVTLKSEEYLAQVIRPTNTHNSRIKKLMVQFGQLILFCLGFCLLLIK